MQLKTALKTLLYSVKTTKKPLEHTRLCGVPLQLLRGTVRQQVDQDDAWWFYLAKNHDVIFDIGCNVGYTALLALIQDANKRMVLVDPNPEALQIAAQNIIMNGLGNRVHYVSAFVGNQVDETVKFFTVGSGAAGSMHASHAQTASAINSYINVKTLTLDFLFNYFDLVPDLVKIDVEGAETLVMEASKKLALGTQCSFFVEMHNVEGLGMAGAVQVMLDWCQDMHYKAWYLKTGHELVDVDVVKGRGKCHLLLMPEAKTYPEYLKHVQQYGELPSSV
ncbi:hypothetical protein C1T31_13390 [Hanstruepera neustonica]|uniref:Methyltransferase FkbM domain-containing protein n=1 Tax=Hanstruepera neustonica TaxID=1445657 RepID=A0A2K1DVP1_9FLAO|nr:FkbM family methyltransferase [Hanstruepera neustonica]PNQ72094.1 hypothetical protein C1T31_13390 [Hanstruepera neustonica]